MVSRTGTGALIYYFGVSEPETAHLLKSLLRPGMTVFDLGAHFGEYAVLAGRSVGPTGRIHCFEPEASLVSLLRRNLALNEIENFVVNHSAVSDSDRTVVFERRSELASSSIEGSTQDVDATRIDVPAVSLDDYCARRHVYPDLIKMDVEGAEFLVFQGATSLLRLPATRAPLWVFEYSPSTYKRFDVRFTEVHSLLVDSGYYLFSIHSNGGIEAFRVAAGSENRNLVATKRPDSLARLIA